VDPAWLEGWEPRPFELGDGATEFVVLGQGPMLLLIPPLPGYKEAFAGVAARLARRFRVVTFDLRIRFRGAPTWSALLGDLERIADALAPGPAVVLGHSLGGALAQRWALARPDRVQALILSSSFARVTTPRAQLWKRYVEQPFVLASQRWLPEGWARSLARRFAARGLWVYDRRCDPRVLEFVRLGIRELPLAHAWRCVRLALAHDVRCELHRLRMPTLLVVGERESAFARGATDELARLLPHAERRVAPGVSHLHPLSAPEWLERTVTEWGSYGKTMPSRVGTMP
jgi:pimeloyl-ACP methyl ester carboxylesterase